MTTTKSTKTTTKTTTCWNCGEELQPILDLSEDLESQFELVIKLSKQGVGTQERKVALCHNCASTFGKE
jgi:hypothetical protein